MSLFAYIGPGAGFVLSSSFLVLFGAAAMAMFSLVVWPLRMAWRRVRRKSRLRS